MKLDSSNGVSAQIEGAVKFGISSNSAKLFSMLSTALYSNKEMAVLHELSANAYDEHITANVDKPFDITVPTAADPYFKIRDYGRGLSEENVYKLLTTYGESTKSDSNDTIGAYGIGSKSPAAVTSTWNVISRHNGRMTEYLVFIDRSGIPSITKLQSTACNDSGLEVIIPVQSTRHYNWVDAIPTVFKHYDIKPNVIGAQIRWITHPKVITSGNGWRLYDTSGNTYSSNIQIITSRRGYTLDVTTIRTEFKGAQFLTLLPFKLDIDMPIGSLDLSLSREQLQYTHHTLNTIKEKLTQVYDQLQATITTFLKPAKDGLQYREMVISACKTILNCSPRIIMSFIEGNKYGVENEYDLHSFSFNVKNFAACGFLVSPKGSSRVSELTEKFTCDRTYAIKLDKSVDVKGKISYTVNAKINYLNDLIIINDNARGTRAKVKHQYTNKLVLISNDITSLPKELKRFVVNASDISAPPRSARVKKEKVATTDYWTPYRNSYRKLTPAELKGTNKWVFVEVDNVKTRSTLTQRQEALIDTFKRDGVSVLVIKTGAAEPKFAEHIEMYALNEIERLNTNENALLSATQKLKVQIINSWDNSMNFLRKFSINTTHQSVWNELHQLVKGIVQSNIDPTLVRFGYLQELCMAMDVDIITDTSLPTIDSIKEKLYNTYKLIKHLDSDTPEKVVEEYINMVGK